MNIDQNIILVFNIKNGFITSGDSFVYSNLTVTGILSATTISATTISSPFTTGSVIFQGSGGTLSQNNSQLFWNNTNNRLGIGTNSPSSKLHLVGAGTTNSTTTFTSQNSASAVNGTIYDDGTWFFGGSNTRLSATGGQFDFNSAAGNISRIGHWEMFFRPLQAGSVSLELGTNIKMLNTNVLIGTTTDSGFKLDVNGTARFSQTTTSKLE